jgi:hypothetical protein
MSAIVIGCFKAMMINVSVACSEVGRGDQAGSARRIAGAHCGLTAIFLGMGVYCPITVLSYAAGPILPAIMAPFPAATVIPVARNPDSRAVRPPKKHETRHAECNGDLHQSTPGKRGFPCSARH